MKLILFSIGCPKCTNLERFLRGKKFDYEISSDIEEIKAQGYKEVPVLKVIDKDENGQDQVKYYDFNGTISWVHQQLNKKNTVTKED